MYVCVSSYQCSHQFWQQWAGRQDGQTNRQRWRGGEKEKHDLIMFLWCKNIFPIIVLNMYICLQYVTLPKVSSIMGPGVACWFYLGVPIWIPVAILATTSKCLRFFQISGLGEYLVLLLEPLSNNENKYHLGMDCLVEFVHEVMLPLDTYKYINFFCPGM
jgi:hypothetical protein